MTIEKMTATYSDKYICVKDCIYGFRGYDTLIADATVIKVYDTLEIAEMNKGEIKGLIERYRDFDIVYGDLEDYVNTRKDRHRDISADNGEKLTQKDIDRLISLYKKND